MTKYNKHELKMNLAGDLVGALDVVKKWKNGSTAEKYGLISMKRLLSKIPLETDPKEIFYYLDQYGYPSIITADAWPGGGKGEFIKQAQKHFNHKLTVIAADGHLYVDEPSFYDESIFKDRNKLTIQSPEKFSKGYIFQKDVKSRVLKAVSARDTGKKESVYKCRSYIRMPDGERVIMDDHKHVDKIKTKKYPIFCDGSTTSEIDYAGVNAKNIFSFISPNLGYWSLLKRDLENGHGDTDDALQERNNFRLLEYVYLTPRIIDNLLHRSNTILYNKDYERDVKTWAERDEDALRVETALNRMDPKDLPLEISDKRKERGVRDAADCLREKVLEATL